MRYKLEVVIHKLDGTTVEEKDNEPRSKIKLLDAITSSLRRHESFAGTLTFTVTVDRAE
jgi:hypothetical protein